MKLIKRMIRFIKYNEHKRLTIEAWIYSAYFRFQMLFQKPGRAKRRWGVEGEESSVKALPEQYQYAKKVSYAVGQVCQKTRWESKCLVRALTAQMLLRKKEIPSTFYLGCGHTADGSLVAHAWLRCGEMYVTGGDGKGYAMVAKFRA